MSDVLVDDADGVRILTLNRPAALNALTDDAFDELRRALVSAGSASEIRCVVLTGAGRAFSAGLDLKTFERDRPSDDGERHGFEPCIEEIERFPKPLIAAVNGIAVGFGTTVLLHCDLVIASADARFRLPFVDIGLGPEAGSSYLLSSRIGAQDAAHLLFTASWLEAPRAQELGLVWRIVEPNELAKAASDVARDIAARPLDALLATKGNLIGSRIEAVRAARAREHESYSRLLGGEAFTQAVASFRRAQRS